LSTVTIKGDDGKEYYACSQNENLVTWQQNNPAPLVVVPDITSYLTTEGKFLSNADLAVGIRLHLIGSPCDQKLRDPVIISAFDDLLKGIGYMADILPSKKD